MERFWRWLEGDIDKPRTLGSVIKIVFSALVLNFIWLVAFFYCYRYFSGSHFVEGSKLIGSKIVEFLNVVVCASATEEMIFRYLPILIIKRFIDSLKTAFLNGGNPPEIADVLSKEIHKTKINYFLYTGIISSVIFGLIHGSVLNILIQGVGGMLLWFTFLYCSRLGKDLRIGYFGSVLLHASYNFILILPLLLK